MTDSLIDTKSIDDRKRAMMAHGLLGRTACGSSCSNGEGTPATPHNLIGIRKNYLEGVSIKNMSDSPAAVGTWLSVAWASSMWMDGSSHGESDATESNK